MDSLNKIIEMLEKEYKNPNFNNKSEPMDELIYIILSKRTNYKCNNETYKKLKQKYPEWHLLLQISQKKIYDIIKQGGLGEEKSKNIKNLLRIVYEDFGAFNIKEYFKEWSKKDIFEYLVSLPGIGLKSAYCVMLYSLNISVQPADAHVIRLFYRLGYINYNQNNHHQAQKVIISLCKDFTYEKNYKIHVNFKAHGQEICKKNKQYCFKCILKDYCDYQKKNI